MRWIMNGVMDRREEVVDLVMMRGWRGVVLEGW